MKTIEIFASPAELAREPERFGFERITINHMIPGARCYIIRMNTNHDGTAGEGSILCEVEFVGNTASSSPLFSDLFLFTRPDLLPFYADMWLSEKEPLLIKSPSRRHMCAVDGHVVTDMGGIRGYCRHCDIDLWFDRKTAEFTIYDPFDKINNRSAEA